MFLIFFHPRLGVRGGVATHSDDEDPFSDVPPLLRQRDRGENENLGKPEMEEGLPMLKVRLIGLVKIWRRGRRLWGGGIACSRGVHTVDGAACRASEMRLHRCCAGMNVQIPRPETTGEEAFRS